MKTLDWVNVLDLLERGDPNGDDPLGRILREAKISAVMKALQSTDDEKIRHQLFPVISRRKPKRYIATFIAYLNDPSPTIRFDAADTLARIGVAIAGPDLLQRFHQETDKWAKFRIAEALGAVGYHVAIPQLIESLRDRDEMLRAGAAWALGRLEAKNALPALRSALESENDMYAKNNLIVAISGLTGGPKTLDEFYAHDTDVWHTAASVSKDS